MNTDQAYYIPRYHVGTKWLTSVPSAFCLSPSIPSLSLAGTVSSANSMCSHGEQREGRHAAHAVRITMDTKSTPVVDILLSYMFLHIVSRSLCRNFTPSPVTSDRPADPTARRKSWNDGRAVCPGSPGGCHSGGRSEAGPCSSRARPGVDQCKRASHHQTISNILVSIAPITLVWFKPFSKQVCLPGTCIGPSS